MLCERSQSKARGDDQLRGQLSKLADVISDEGKRAALDYHGLARTNAGA